MSVTRKDITDLRAKEARLEKALIESIARYESLNDDKEYSKEQRDKLKDRKAKGKTYDAEELAQYIDAVRKNNIALKEVRRNIRKRKGWLSRIRESIETTRVALRKQEKPKVIDLNLNFRPMDIQDDVNKVIGHYTAGPRDKDTKDAIRLCRLYHEAHLAKGWSGEAYMLCFTIDGNILVLRPAKYVGAHTLGYNTGSYGIMMHGTTGDKPSNAQLKALRWWAENGDKPIMGDGRTEVKPASLKWYGHNDYNATSCPGEFKNGYVSKGKNK